LAFFSSQLKLTAMKTDFFLLSAEADGNEDLSCPSSFIILLHLNPTYFTSLFSFYATPTLNKNKK